MREIKFGLFYILKEKEIIPIDNRVEWGKWFENNKERFIKQDNINNMRISTIFLGFDHSFGLEKDKIPILFETMVFPEGDWDVNYCERYHTYDEALEGHQRIVEKVKKGEKL